MRRSTVTAIITVLVLIALVGIAYVASRPGNPTTSPSPSPSARPSAATSPSVSPTVSASASASSSTVTVDFTSAGFSPASVKVKTGGTIIFKNSTTAAIQPSSDPHPVHTDNPELNVGRIEPGKTAVVTVTRAGTWGMHDHLDTSKKLQIIVE